MDPITDHRSHFEPRTRAGVEENAVVASPSLGHAPEQSSCPATAGTKPAHRACRSLPALQRSPASCTDELARSPLLAQFARAHRAANPSSNTLPLPPWLAPALAQQ